MTEKTTKKDTRFQKGRSGNPGGRPSAGLGKIRADLVTAWEDIRPVLIEKAKGGDMAAIRIVAERVCPPIKATEPATPISLPEGSLTDRAKSVLAGLADGTLNPGQAAQLLQALGAVAKVHEVDELARRIEALEARNGGK
jgi:hypothetical protein